MRVDAENVRAIAELARLELGPDEISVYTAQLGQIIEYVDALGEVDTSGVDPMAHVLPLANVLRDDDVQASMPQSETLRNAPDTDGAFYRVPRIIE